MDLDLAARQATRRAEHSHVVTNLGQQRGRGQWGVKSVTVTERRPRAGHAKATPTDDVIRGPCEDRNHPVILVLTARRGSESPTPTCTIGGRITAMINSTGSTAAINGTVVTGVALLAVFIGFLYTSLGDRITNIENEIDATRTELRDEIAARVPVSPTRLYPATLTLDAFCGDGAACNWMAMGNAALAQHRHEGGPAGDDLGWHHPLPVGEDRLRSRSLQRRVRIVVADGDERIEAVAHRRRQTFGHALRQQGAGLLSGTSHRAAQGRVGRRENVFVAKPAPRPRQQRARAIEP
ncbi:MAG: hypothetical protein OXI22_18210 [Defluviicoccus sp.]|nr:hypothetical protein [Defluviicoccus sp.]